MKWITFALSTLILSSINVSEASGGKGKHHKMAEHMKKELDLTDDQLAKIKEIRKGKKEGMKSSREEMKKLKTDFKEAMKNPKASKEELLTKFEALQKAQNGFHKERFLHMLEMRSILKPDQLEKFNKLHEKHRGSMRSHGKKKD